MCSNALVANLDSLIEIALIGDKPHFVMEMHSGAVASTAARRCGFNFKPGFSLSSSWACLGSSSQTLKTRTLG